MKAFVVDVNVAIVANGRALQADDKCRMACLEALKTIIYHGMIVLDDGMRILKEYMDNLSMSGEPGVGDIFMKWVWENQAFAERCEQVPLVCKENDPENFMIFPEDPDLRAFDRSDRKYAAVALASSKNPLLLNAVDTDWWHHREAFERNGVRFNFLCPQHMHNIMAGEIS